MEEELMLGFGETGEAAELSEMAAAETFSEEEDDFEFAFSIESEPGSLKDSSADEIFYNGRILPVYPVFNRGLIGGSGNPKEEEDLAEGLAQLMLGYEKRGRRAGSESSSSSIMSETKDLEWMSKSAPANFVPPSPDRWRKSSSTGSSASASASRKWKLRDLVVGRSRSDGKERFVVIPVRNEKVKEKEKEKEKEKQKKAFRSINSLARASADAEKKEKGGKGKGETVKEMDIVTAHRIYYGKGGSAGAPPAAAGGTRRSFLPYRQELLGGIFGNAKHHPF